MKLRIVLVAILALLVVGVTSVGAQSQPNLEANRLYFIAITSSLVDVETPALSSYLNTAGVAGSEHQAAVQALMKFKNRYAALSDAYNNSPATLAGTNEDTALFLAQRDMLVQNTIELLQASLSATSFSNFTKQVSQNAINIRTSNPTPLTMRHRHGTMMLPVQAGMFPHYSTSRSSSVSFDSNGNATYYEVVVIDGYTDCGSGCPAGVTHQGVVTNTLNIPPPGGTVRGPQVTPSSHIHLTNETTAQFSSSCFNPNTPCSEDPWTESADVNCSRIGAMDSWGSYGFAIEPAITTFVNEGVIATAPPNIKTYLVSNWCLPEYCPPDNNNSTVIGIFNGNPLYFLSDALCVSSVLWNGWQCSGIDTPIYTSEDLQYCTKNPPPY